MLRSHCRDCNRQKSWTGKTKEGSGINRPLQPLPAELPEVQIPMVVLTGPSPSIDPIDSMSSETPLRAPVEILPEIQFAFLDLTGSSLSICSFDSNSSRRALPPTRKNSVMVNREEAPKIDDDEEWSLNLTPVDISILGMESFMANKNGSIMYDLDTDVIVSKDNVEIV